MCGICGMVGHVNKTLLKRMCDVLKHRGPDDSGFFVDDNVGLGNRRLSIIDVAGGRQPIHNEDESVWITFNGEIYNFLELRDFLEKKGHRFYTNTDTEVIVHAYEEFGYKCVEKLRGMFAFAIWDCREKKLLLSRDRLGIKPLYYTIIDGKLIFASEIKSILQNERIKRKVNQRALHYFLALRYVPGPDTMFQGIYKLQPGHVLTWKDGKIEIKRYWKLKMKPSNKPERYYFERLYEMLRESVKIRLMSEVPLGAYLSGGIDSSSVVALMSEVMDNSVNTFSVGFGEERTDELKYSRLIAEHFETNHHEFIVEPEKVDLLPRIVWHFDEPVADPAAIPTYLISEKAKKYVTVVLTGEGGDEVFGGYEQQKALYLTKKYLGYIPPPLMKFLCAPLRITPIRIYDMFFKFTSSMGNKVIDRMSDYLKYVNVDVTKGYMKIPSVFLFDENEVKEVLKTKNYSLYDLYKKYLDGSDKNNILRNTQIIDIEIPLPENLLMKTDKMTMAHSMEARVPLLDHELVEFSMEIPDTLKINGLTEKFILRRVMQPMMPRDIMKRKKHRFLVPIDTWFDGELGEIFQQLFSEENVRKLHLFNYNYIKHILNNFKSSRLYYSRQMWSLLNFEVWRQIFIDENREKIKLSR